MPDNIDSNAAQRRARLEPDPVAYGSPAVRRQSGNRSNLATGLMVVAVILVIAVLLFVFIWRGS